MTILDLSWSDGTIGEFSGLSEFAQANRALLQELADYTGAGLLTRVVSAGTLQLRDLTSGAAPVDTGTLRSAHRGTVEPYGNGAQGIVEIDPYVRNPVNQGKPAYYGEVWAMRFFNWFEQTAAMHGEEVLDRMEQTITQRIDEIWA